MLEPYAINRIVRIPKNGSRRTDRIEVTPMTEIWHCEPPHAGITYHVTADTWNDDHTERTIHTIEIVEDSDAQTNMPTMR